MTRGELREMVREVVRRRLDERAAAGSARRVAPGCQDHPSHGLYVTVVNADEACVIEPGVRCDHCGYCKSHGH